jgi:hypothetical protein
MDNEKLHFHIKESEKLLEWVESRNYECDNLELDTICTYLAFCLKTQCVSSAEIDKIPRLVHQIKNAFRIYEKED